MGEEKTHQPCVLPSLLARDLDRQEVGLGQSLTSHSSGLGDGYHGGYVLAGVVMRLPTWAIALDWK